VLYEPDAPEGSSLYGPTLNIHCTTLDGPATVRISNAAL
jgi:hypothetical protein